MKENDFREKMNADIEIVDANIISLTQTCSIYNPPTEDYIPISKTNIDKMKRHCANLKKKPNLSDLYLGLFTAILGFIISGALSGINFDKNFIFSIILYCVCPALAVIFFALYYISRRLQRNEDLQLLDKISEYIIEPYQKSIDEGEFPNEH